MFNHIDWTYLLYSLPAILIALTFHEVAHGWVAYRLGDDTAKLSGRLTLNPLRHLDPIGFILMVVARFGWAKPVPVNPLNFRGNRKTGMLWVALAGPVMNILLAYLAVLILHLLEVLINNQIISYNPYFITFIQVFFQINVVLASFNLIPLPPLDGSKILAGLLPYRFGRFMYQYERYSSLILIVLAFTGVLYYIYAPVANGLLILLPKLAGLY